MLRSWWRKLFPASRSLTPAPRRRKAPRPAARTARLSHLLRLEDRLAPAADIWQGAAGGLWSVGSNWSLGAAPGGSDVAVFDPSMGGTNTSSTIDAAFAGTVAGVTID